MQAIHMSARSIGRRPSQIDPSDGICIFILVLCGVACGFAQMTPPPQAQGAPLTITLQDALQRARLNEPQYHSAITDLGLAREDRVQARAGLLPSVTYDNSFT